MRKKISAFVFLMVVGLMGPTLIAQTTNSLPKIDLKGLDGKVVNTSSFANDGKPLVVSFWATWCKPCVKELDVYAEHYSDWKAETGVKIVAISVDNARSMSRVSPFVGGKGWEFDVYLDSNEDFKRAMNVVNVPHTFLLDGAGNVVWQHTSYADGDEEELLALLRKLSAGEKLK